MRMPPQALGDDPLVGPHVGLEPGEEPDPGGPHGAHVARGPVARVEHRPRRGQSRDLELGEGALESGDVDDVAGGHPQVHRQPRRLLQHVGEAALLADLAVVVGYRRERHARGVGQPRRVHRHPGRAVRHVGDPREVRVEEAPLGGLVADAPQQLAHALGREAGRGVGDARPAALPPAAREAVGLRGGQRVVHAQAPELGGVRRRRGVEGRPQALRGRQRVQRPRVAEVEDQPLRRHRPPARGCRAELAGPGVEGERAALAAAEHVAPAVDHPPEVARLLDHLAVDPPRGHEPRVGPVALPRVAHEHGSLPMW